MTDPNYELVSGRYRLLEVLGEGGQAIVYRARDEKTGGDVAVKVLLQRAHRDPAIVERVAREQQAMVALAGTRAVQFVDLCTASSGALCLVMELLEGRDLQELLDECERTGEPLVVEQMVELIEPIVDTLHQAHSVGIIHRDLKPSNIFITPAGTRLLDFGFARLVSSQSVTQPGMVMGSPSYIAPEMWKGDPSAATPRSDVYSLGVVVFRMLGGQLPFRGESLQQKLVEATKAERPSLHALRPGLPDTVDIWVERALAIDPEDRFPSVRASWGELLWALGLSEHPALSKSEPAPKQLDVKSVRQWLERPIAALPQAVNKVWRAAAQAFRRFKTNAEQGRDGTEPASASEPAEAQQPLRLRLPPLPEAPQLPTVAADAQLEHPTVLLPPTDAPGPTPDGARAPLPPVPMPPRPTGGSGAGAAATAEPANADPGPAATTKADPRPAATTKAEPGPTATTKAARRAATADAKVFKAPAAKASARPSGATGWGSGLVVGSGEAATGATADRDVGRSPKASGSGARGALRASKGAATTVEQRESRATSAADEAASATGSTAQQSEGPEIGLRAASAGTAPGAKEPEGPKPAAGAPAKSRAEPVTEAETRVDRVATPPPPFAVLGGAQRELIAGPDSRVSAVERTQPLGDAISELRREASGSSERTLLARDDHTLMGVDHARITRRHPSG